jgi:CheY-like chemotaxis protein
MDGVELAKALHAAGVTEPIICASASVEAEAREAVRAAGMDDFLEKPVLRPERANRSSAYGGTRGPDPSSAAGRNAEAVGVKVNARRSLGEPAPSVVSRVC